eukprot:TRINITY_DN1486_c0_g1_i1.p3 TRINITY_DN1486_c0_g1~~TRINITY_DN1486_c0_g1_i1.p3  ORF type:complete len:151 (+),score=51.46 TRINITY_DN1486_c0_g1_i1:133-585(+)
MDVGSIPTEVMDELREAFGLFDRDSDGFVSALELAILLRSVGVSPTQLEVDAYVKKVDGERSTGLISFEEFVYFANELREKDDSDDLIVATFNYLDKDRSGYISATELRRILTNLGDVLSQEEVDEMFREADVEGNLVSREEFMHMMRKQ